MTRKDKVFLFGMMVVAALLVANLLKPTAPNAAETAGEAAYYPVPTHISAAGDSAWAMVGNKVYYLSIRPRSDFPVTMRTINTIDSKVLE